MRWRIVMMKQAIVRPNFILETPNFISSNNSVENIQNDDQMQYQAAATFTH